MANKSQDARRAASKKGKKRAGENAPSRCKDKTPYQKERDAAKNAPHRKHNR